MGDVSIHGAVIHSPFLDAVVIIVFVEFLKI